MRANRGAEVAGCVDQPDVAECPRGVPELAMGHGIVLLAEQAEIVAHGQQPFKQRLPGSTTRTAPPKVSHSVSAPASSRGKAARCSSAVKQAGESIRQAQPVDGTVPANQRRGVQVTDQPVVV